MSVLCTIALVLAVSPSVAHAQAQVRSFPTQPILVLNTGGHSAPVRSLVFSEPDGSQLISAGMDKVVNVWTLQDGRPGLTRTLRPPIWRGYRGVIYAMALSPSTVNRPRRLAVAGFGVESNQSRITIFRFPGANLPTGDIETLLPTENVGSPQPTGHTNTVMGLAFDPTGKEILASCSMDATVRLWDLQGKRLLGVLRGHRGPVNAVAFTPDGQQLVTGGEDGILRLWDVASRGLIAQVSPPVADRNPNDPRAEAILALAVTPDGRSVIVGRENGILSQFSADLRTAARLTNEIRGPVEALAISPDGKQLATSIVARRNAPTDRPRVECEVELRSLPDGRVTSRVTTATNLVYALAFSANNRFLAYAGGDAQGVYLKDLTQPNRPVMALEGAGRSVWDVGFQADSQAVGYSRARADLPGAPQSYEGFATQNRQVVTLDRAQLRGASPTYQGWTIRPTSPLSLAVVNAQNVSYPITLDAETDRRWWSYGFIPAGPGHSHATVAIGCEGGVAIYTYDATQRGYRRTRMLAGHNGPVYTLAPSPDGRWLATGSSDQTVRLWRLAGCDVLPPLGATFEAAVVKSVEPLGFADAMGMQAGDRVELFIINRARQPLDRISERVAAVAPGTMVEFQVLRGNQRVNLGTTRRDAPALTLFPGQDREWVLWMPEGYYETSIAGDRRFLGWQRNRANLTQPTDYFAIDRFEPELHRPVVLERLWTTADLNQALATLANPRQDTSQLVDQNRPPSVQITAPARVPDRPLVVQAAGLAVTARVSSEGQRPIRSVRFLVDSRQGPEFNINPPRADVDQNAQLDLSPGVHRVNVIAVNDQGKERAESFDLVYNPPQPRQPQLWVRAIGVGEFSSSESLAIPFADRDADGVEQFFKEQAQAHFGKVDAPSPILGAAAKAQKIQEVLAELDGLKERGEIVAGDSVVLMIESHLLVNDQGSFITGSDADASNPNSASVPTADITNLLGGLADYGCRVMLLLDDVHESTPKAWNSRVNDWARQLWKRNVVVFVASNQGPSQRLAFRYRRGAFAQGVLDALDLPTRSRLWVDPKRAFTLHDFQEAVVNRVQDLTSRRQVPACYVPETLSSQIPLFEPHRAPVAEEASKD